MKSMKAMKKVISIAVFMTAILLAGNVYSGKPKDTGGGKASIISGGNHATMSNLSYTTAGHTGFYPSTGGTISGAASVAGSLTAHSTMTVVGNAFSVGGGTFSVKDGMVSIDMPQSVARYFPLTINANDIDGDGKAILIRSSSGTFFGGLMFEVNDEGKGASSIYTYYGTATEPELILGTYNNRTDQVIFRTNGDIDVKRNFSATGSITGSSFSVTTANMNIAGSSYNLTLSTESFNLDISSTLAVGDKHFTAVKSTITVFQMHASIDTAPVGSDITITVQYRNNAGAWANIGDGSLTIVDGTTKSVIELGSTVIPANSDVKAVVTAVGSGTAGSDLSVAFKYSKAVGQ